MSSQRRKLASRANGRKSQGPKTPEGKARSSQNAFRHGFLSQQVVLPNESAEQFQILFRQYADRFAPSDAAGFGFVEEMAASYWRMRRLWAVETQNMAEAIADEPEGDETARLAAAWRRLASEPETALLCRYESLLSQRFNRAFHNFLLLRKLPQPNEPSPKNGHPATLPEPAPAAPASASCPAPAASAIFNKVETLDSWLSHFLTVQHGVSGTVHITENDGLKLAAAVNIPEPVRQAVAYVPNGKGMAGLALQQGIPIQTCNLKEDNTGAVKPGAKAVNAKAAVAIPIKTSTGPIRAVVGIAFQDERQFTDADLASLTEAAATLPETP